MAVNKPQRFSNWVKINYQKLLIRLKKSLKNVQFFFESWIYLVRVVFKRIFSGFKNIDFVIYFVIVIIVVGSFGFSDLIYKVYILGYKDSDTIYQLAKALNIYFIAIIATSSADLILNRDPNEKEARSLRMPGLSFLILGGFISFLIQYNLTNFTTRLSYYGTAGALLLWWITNSTDKKWLHEQINQDNLNTIGGEELDVDNLNDNIPNVLM